MEAFVTCETLIPCVPLLSLLTSPLSLPGSYRRCLLLESLSPTFLDVSRSNVFPSSFALPLSLVLLLIFPSSPNSIIFLFLLDREGGYIETRTFKGAVKGKQKGRRALIKAIKRTGLSLWFYRQKRTYEIR